MTLVFRTVTFGVESSWKAARLRRMKTFCRFSSALLGFVMFQLAVFGGDRPRVFITDTGGDVTIAAELQRVGRN